MGFGWMLKIWTKVYRHCNISIEGHSRIICAAKDVLKGLTKTFTIPVENRFPISYNNTKKSLTQIITDKIKRSLSLTCFSTKIQAPVRYTTLYLYKKKCMARLRQELNLTYKVR